MSELDRLRHAMRVTERPGGAIDLAAVMRDGRRLRTRRRVAGAGVATLAAGLAGVVVAVVVGALPNDPGTVERPPPVAVAPAPPTDGPATPPDPSATMPPTTAARTEPPPSPLGEVIDSGVRHGADQRVYYLVRVSVPGEPRVSIGLAAGRRAPNGTLTTDILVNDVEGSDRSPGFHQIGYDEGGSAAPVPAFGYFVGPAHRITGTVDGRQVAARLARWSADKQVVIFWFDPADLAPGDRLDGITARDGSNRRL
ncbi:hypothetical protein DKT68_08340 [Micromonospora acroterricola]|uniref:Uncharacterized protein n=1 Tax=Micromonospora acroterricola TaxID=2202421 RepID=A0A317DD86_9ACTN|nr:hypothetical protein [Micromonospora acroterricola]PWR10615.1 hypothetical protein DKT68_08340 [Micromonospora acroterricola]